jgi:hypothetical protein
LNLFYVEFSEGENFYEFPGFEAGEGEKLFVVHINDVAIRVDQVAFIIDPTAHVVKKFLSVLGGVGDNSAQLVLIKLAHNILDVVALTRKSEKFGDITFRRQLLFVKLFTA